MRFLVESSNFKEMEDITKVAGVKVARTINKRKRQPSVASGLPMYKSPFLATYGENYIHEDRFKKLYGIFTVPLEKNDGKIWYRVTVQFSDELPDHVFDMEEKEKDALKKVVKRIKNNGRKSNTEKKEHSGVREPVPEESDSDSDSDTSPVGL